MRQKHYHVVVSAAGLGHVVTDEQHGSFDAARKAAMRVIRAMPTRRIRWTRTYLYPLAYAVWSHIVDGRATIVEVSACAVGVCS